MDDLHSHPWTELKRVERSVSRSISWRDFDLRYAMTRVETGEKIYHLGELVPQYIKTPCVLCQTVRDIVASKYEVAPGWTYTLKPTKLGELNEPTQTQGRLDSQTKDRCARRWLSIEVDDQSLSQTRPHIANAIHGATRPLPKPCYTGQRPAPSAQRAFLYGRPRALECDIKLLNSWLHLCKTYHITQCGRERARCGPAIRLIDTKAQRIVAYRPGDPRVLTYVALSYVCGDKGQSYISAVVKYSHLANDGSLKNLNLPHTISDAISLVQRLGLQYLWVDALCIDQDDSSDRAEQISDIGFVYENALFTIIAASGIDCEAGLPGVRAGTRFNEQRIVEAGDIVLLSSIQTPSDRSLTSETSKWARRGWTFQEELLSSRQIIFTDEQVWWRCGCATWCEDSQLETRDLAGFLLTGQEYAEPLKQRFSTLEPETYFKLAADYAQRQLTFASDALNAFAGTLSMSTDYSREQFLWAI